MMEVFLKTEDEIGLMREANKLVAETLSELARHIKPGVTTLQLDAVAEQFIRDNGGEPIFKGFPNPFGAPFPANICTSVNDVVVHGIPDKRTILRDGDIISIDCGVRLNGLCGDSCYTFRVGQVSDDVSRLLQTTKEALYKGIEKAVDGCHTGDIGHAVQTCCESRGYGVVRELTGHGIGREMHEQPRVPNYGRRHTGVTLRNGMCIAIEPMTTLGHRAIGLMPDRWSIKIIDGKPAAHFEHTVVVRHGKAEILSSFEEIEHYEGTLN